MNTIDSLTEAEQGYFIACTDIFHDSTYAVIGRPSMSNQIQNTVVMNLELTISQSDFANVTPGSNWDVNIVSFPFLTTQSLITAQDNGYSVYLPSATSRALVGGVTCFASNAGAGTILPNNPTKSLNANNFFYPEYNGSGTEHIIRPYYEVLSIGMEVINSTPELYKGGNVVRYRVPTQGRKASIRILNGEDYSMETSPAYETYCYPLPPRTEAFATQYPDSVIDKAGNGSYQMHTLQDDVSDFYLAGNSRIMLSQPAPPGEPPAGANCLYSASAFKIDAAYDPPLIRGDFDIIGSYFTGLSPQTTLKIRSRAVVSLVPSSSDAKLVSLAKPSPDPNPALDALIHKVQATFSPGIESSMNASGDWWKIVLKGVAKLAPTVGKLVGGNTGETIGKGVAAAAGAVSNAASKKKKKTPPKALAKPVPKKAGVA